MANPATGADLAVASFANIPMTVRDEAVFTDFTFKINPKFDVQVGGRANIDRQRFIEDQEGGINILDGLTGFSPLTDSKFTSYTYLLTPRYFLLRDGLDTVMTYARFASGFRPGGPNLILGSFGALGPAGAGLTVPTTYGADKTYNYELGVKADLLDRRLTLDLSTFYIDWRNIQISEVVQNNGAIVNGSRARSDGVEFQTEVRPLPGLTIDANFTYNDARLRSGVNPGNFASTNGIEAMAGERLPFTAEYTGNFDVNQEFPLPFGSGLRGFVGAQLSYVGGRPDLFQNPNAAATVGVPSARQDLPAYTQVNTRAGVTYNTWTIEAYATNLADRRGILEGGASNEIPPTGFYFINPRTVGVEVSETF